MSAFFSLLALFWKYKRRFMRTICCRYVPLTPEGWCSGGSQQPPAHVAPLSRIFLPWRWRQFVPPKRRFTQDLHGPISRNRTFFNRSTCFVLKFPYICSYIWGGRGILRDLYPEILKVNAEITETRDSSEIHLYRQQPSGELLNSYCKFEQILMIENIYV
jgi:hypothetical protein